MNLRRYQRIAWLKLQLSKVIFNTDDKNLKGITIYEIVVALTDSASEIIQIRWRKKK